MPWSDTQLQRFDEATTVGGPRIAKPSPEVTVLCLTVLWHADADRVGNYATLEALSDGGEVALSRREPRFLDPGTGLARPLADPHVSRRPIRLAPGEERGQVRLLDADSQVICMPASQNRSGAMELTADQVENGVALGIANRIVLLLHWMPQQRIRPQRFGLVGDSAALLRLRRDIQRLANSDVPVLLRGETGTGKELVARALHRSSPRHAAPYLTVNIGAIPRDLAASELFGASRGAFTGADSHRQGYFAAADGGTLFLDEIGECPTDIQVLLLRSLESGEIQPVGAKRTATVNVRVLSATDADLEAAVRAGEFRAPLLHRLNGFTLHLPPLRQRRDDIGRLLVHFLRLELEAIGEPDKLISSSPHDPLWLPAAVVARMALSYWPGNVRQLRNTARHLVLSQRGAPRVEVDPSLMDLLEESDSGCRPKVKTPTAVLSSGRSPQRVYRSPSEVSEQELREALEQHGWQLKAAAVTLGISRPSLYALIERHPHLRTAARLGKPEIAIAMKQNDGDLALAAAELEVSPQALQRRMSDLGMS